MAFSQLHYTSCQTGLSGHSGFQFCAMTPGIQPEVMREVERLTVYEQPRVTHDTSAGTNASQYPTNLLYTRSETADAVIIARVTFAGLDFSQRSGNYFAHSLISGNLDDLSQLLPIELWDAPFWSEVAGPDTDLPEIITPLLKGPTTRHSVSRAVESSQADREILRILLTTADEAMNGGRRTLLLGTGSSEVFQLIAAVSYLLGPVLGQRLTFSTYVHDPRRCPTHIVGTVPDVNLMREATVGYRIVDPAGVLDPGRPIVPDVRPSASAILLARIGVQGAADVWATALSLGRPSNSRSLDNWFPVLACAALILKHELRPTEMATAVDWLAASDQRGNERELSTVVSTCLDRHVVNQLNVRHLQLLAQRADGLRGNDMPRLATAVEREVVRDALSRAARREPPGPGLELRTERAVAMAAEGCAHLIRNAETIQAVHLLAWAAQSHIGIDNRSVEKVGHDLLLSYMRDRSVFDQEMSVLAEVSLAWPKLRTGIVAAITSLSHEQRDTAMASDLCSFLGPADFDAAPSLYEGWLAASISNGRSAPAQAFIQWLEWDHRHRSSRPLDETIIDRFWKPGEWAFAEADDVLKRLAPEDLVDGPLADRMLALLRMTPDPDDLASWADFVISLKNQMPAGAWSKDVVKYIVELSRMAKVLKRFFQEREAAAQKPTVHDRERAEEKVDNTIYEIIGLTVTSKTNAKIIIGYLLSPIILNCPHPARALSLCPMEVLQQFCEYALAVIEYGERATSLLVAAQVFSAVKKFRDEKEHGKANYLEQNVLFPTVCYWPKSDINDLGVELDKILRHGSTLLAIWHLQNSRTRRQVPWRKRKNPDKR